MSTNLVPFLPVSRLSILCLALHLASRYTSDGYSSSNVGRLIRFVNTSRIAPGVAGIILLIICSRMGRGRKSGLIAISGVNANVVFANTSTPNSSANLIISGTSNNPGVVNVKSIRIMRLFLACPRPCLKFSNHSSYFNPVRIYSPTSPTPSRLAHICQSLILSSISLYKFTP